MSGDAPAACPVCGSDAVVPIVYGFPGPDLWAAAEQGSVAIGGCIVSEDAPTGRCRACGARVWEDGRFEPAADR